MILHLRTGMPEDGKIAFGQAMVCHEGRKMQDLTGYKQGLGIVNDQLSHISPNDLPDNLRAMRLVAGITLNCPVIETILMPFILINSGLITHYGLCRNPL
jgi:hypothetical protein